MPIRPLIPALACILLSAATPASGATPPFKAWIALEREPNGVIVRPYCQSTDDSAIHYRLRSLKSGRSGTSESTQSGASALQAGQAKPLATVRLGLAKDDQIRVELQIFHAGDLVADEQLNLQP